MNTLTPNPSSAHNLDGLPSTLDYLRLLNDVQRTAVTFSQDIPLQILAGPGSGKTRVLTSRVAYLIHHYALEPWQIVAVTFTNKASQEMRARLTTLLGHEVAKKLVLGTFHKTCVDYLRKYGNVIGLPPNFSITDAEDGKKIINTHLKKIQDGLKLRHISLKDAQVQGEISKAKAKAETPAGMLARARKLGPAGQILEIIAELYENYETALREADCLDFDDLLLYGVKLFKKAPKIIAKCRHILVDEFQDTNTTQYELMKLFAQASGGVTVVGDPDQSIYGWRAAEIENLQHMRRDFPGTEAVYLEENYRSTGSILAASLAIVSQDDKRIAKGLYTSHAEGLPVTLKPLPNPSLEASYIAEEIKRQIAYSGGMLNHGDFAILLRYNALSRPIEVALQREGIPNRLMGGHKFFERMEVKDLLAYLQLADNPGFQPAFIRSVNVPKRSMGDKSVQDLLAAARAKKISAMQLAEEIVGGVEQAKAGLKKNLTSFVRVIWKLREMAAEGIAVANMLEYLIEELKYEDHLRRTTNDFDSRWENVKELISYSVVVAEQKEQQVELPEVELDDFMPASKVPSTSANTLSNFDERRPPIRQGPSPAHKSDEDIRRYAKPFVSTKGKGKAKAKVNNDVIEIDGSDEEEETAPTPEIEDAIEDTTEIPNADLPLQTPLSIFLSASMLSTDTESQDDKDNKPRVTMLTVHGSKGLEWPVVFVPCVEDGTYPFYKSDKEDEIREERRLLYVATTRAQASLTLTYSREKMSGGFEQERLISRFVAGINLASSNIFSSALPVIGSAERILLGKVLSRPLPDEATTVRMIDTYKANAKPTSAWNASSNHARQSSSRGNRLDTFWDNSRNKEQRAQKYWAAETDEYELPPISGNAEYLAMKVPTESRFDPRREGFVSAGRVRPDTAPRARLPSSAKTFQSINESSSKPITAASKMEYPEPVAFDFGSNTMQDLKPRGVTDFTKAQQSSLSMMKTLGLPPPVTSLSKPDPRSVGPGFSASVSTFQNNQSSSLAMMRNLGAPPSQPSTGKRRLGMGRPPAPWPPAKRQKDDTH